MHRRTLLETALATAAAPRAKAADAPPLKFDVSICLDSQTLLWVPLRLIGAPPGLMHKPLRRLDDGSLRSAVVRMPPRWQAAGPSDLRTTVQIYVLEGSLQLGDTALAKSGYAALPAGYHLPRLGSVEGAVFLLIADGDPALDPPATGSPRKASAADAVIVHDVPQDRTTRLWQDKATGANTSFIHTAPGWTTDGPEYHPCQEEIFCISGDIAPDDIRVMKAGWFLWNPPYAVHGWHLHSVTGSCVLEWHDRAWSRTVYKG